MQLSLVSSYYISLFYVQYPPHHPVLEHPQRIFFPSGRESKYYTAAQNNLYNYSYSKRACSLCLHVYAPSPWCGQVSTFSGLLLYPHPPCLFLGIL